MVELELGRTREIYVRLGVAPGEERVSGGEDEGDDCEDCLAQEWW